jgi:hypothetical protein
MGSDTIPRRARLDLMTPAERAIVYATRMVEEMAADVRLTDAVVLLGAARESVADYVDGVDTRRRSVEAVVAMRTVDEGAEAMRTIRGGGDFLAGHPQYDAEAAAIRTEAEKAVLEIWHRVLGQDVDMKADLPNAVAGELFAMMTVMARQRREIKEARADRARDLDNFARQAANAHGIGPDTDGGPNPDYKP